MAKGPKVTAASTFGLKLGGAETDGLFESISGIGSSIMPVQHKSVDKAGKTVYSTIPGSKADFSDITLTRAFSKEKAIYDWHRAIIDKGIKGQTKDITIEFLDDEKKAITTWAVKQAWPVSHQLGGVAAANSSPLIESWTFAHQGIERK
jgi:phage tail-like protein